MQLSTWRPFRDLDEYFGRSTSPINTDLPSVFNDSSNKAGQWAPSADISETKSEYLIKAALPDVKKSDIHISVSDGALKIEGERKHRDEEQGETYHWVESFYGNFSRAFTLPSNVDASNIKADCAKGVLRVHLPKTEDSEPQKPREIEVG